MKNGVYYSDKFDDLVLLHDESIECYQYSILHAVNSRIRFMSENYEYIGEFWDESAELERYKKALDLCREQRNEHASHRDISNNEYELLKDLDEALIMQVLYGEENERE